MSPDSSSPDDSRSIENQTQCDPVISSSQLPEYLYAVVLIPSLYPPDLTNPKLELWMIVELKPKLLWELGLDPNLLQVLFFLLEPF